MQNAQAIESGRMENEARAILLGQKTMGNDLWKVFQANPTPENLTALSAADPAMASAIIGAQQGQSNAQRQIDVNDAVEAVHSLNAMINSPNGLHLAQTAYPDQLEKITAEHGISFDDMSEEEFTGLAVKFRDHAQSIIDMNRTSGVGGNTVPANIQYMEYLAQNMTQEERDKMLLIRAGLEAPAANAQAKDIGGVPHVFDPVSQIWSPAEVAGQTITAKTVGQNKGTITDMDTRAKGKATMSMKVLEGASIKIGIIDNNIANLGRTRELLDNALGEGVNTGPIISRMPRFDDGAIELLNMQAQLGIDLLKSVTFGALSEKELEFALDTVMPIKMKGPALSDWLKRKEDAQQKLRGYLIEQIAFLNAGGSLPDWIAKVEADAAARNAATADTSQSTIEVDGKQYKKIDIP
jgi:hypothetical protein